MTRRNWNKGERKRVLYFWRWSRRIFCHMSIMPCQYVDDANDNNRSRRW